MALKSHWTLTNVKGAVHYGDVKSLLTNPDVTLTPNARAFIVALKDPPPKRAYHRPKGDLTEICKRISQEIAEEKEIMDLFVEGEESTEEDLEHPHWVRIKDDGYLDHFLEIFERELRRDD